MREKRKAEPQPTKPRPKPYTALPSPPPSVLLLWVYRSSLSHLLCLNVIREVASYYPCPTFLAGIYKRQLYLVDIHSYMVVPIPLDITDQRLYFLTRNKILCAGYLESADIHIVDFFPIVITKLPVQVARDFPCRFHIYNSLLYAFQLGYVDCEKYSFATNKWEVIPHSRFLYQYPWFSVLWQHYCFFYMKQEEFIIFNFPKETHQKLPYQLPRFTVVGTVLNTEGEVLLVCENCRMYRYNVGTFQLVYLGSPKHPWKWPLHQGYALGLGDEVFWLDRETPQLRKINAGRKEKTNVKLALYKNR